MKLRLLAIPMAVATALFAAGTVLAWPANSISVETNGCDYTIQVNQDHPNAFIGWEVRVFAASPKDGALVKSGSGTADAQGHITIGPFTGDAGHYNALLDYTLPVSQYAEVVDFTLTCGTETSTTTSTSTETSTDTSTETSTVTSTETSTATETSTSTETTTSTSTSTETSTSTSTSTSGGAELGESGTPPTTPTGAELGAVGTPGVTPPPTDTGSPASTPSNDGWRGVLIALAGLIAGALWLVRVPATVAIRNRHR